MNLPNDTELDILLDDMTRRILASDRPDGLFASVNLGPALGFLPLILSLKAAYRREAPSRRYTRRLHSELMGHEFTVIDRVRFLPARVQIAALLAVMGTILVLLRGRAMLGGQGSVSGVEAIT